MDRDKALLDAIKRVGSSYKLAKLIGITPQALAGWNSFPVERVPDIERATGISRHELRPDFWSPPEPAE